MKRCPKCKFFYSQEVVEQLPKDSNEKEFCTKCGNNGLVVCRSFHRRKELVLKGVE